MNYDRNLYEMLSQYTIDVAREDMRRWKEEEVPPYQGMPKVLFMGTGGNPVNLLEQPRQTGGFILYLPGFTLAVDPGPCAIWHVKQNGVDLRGLNGIYISHGHTDHYLGAPLMIEGMTRVMSQRRGMLMVPQDVIEDSLISTFHQGRHREHEGYVGGPAVLRIHRENESIALTPEITLTPVKAYHGKHNHGFIIATSDMTIGYTSDTSYIQEYEDQSGQIVPVEKWEPVRMPVRVTRYYESIQEAFSKVDYLIANVSYFNLFAHRHITAVGLAHLLAGSRVKRCFLTHFDACYSRPEPMAEKMAVFVRDLTGVDAVSAEDNREYVFAEC